MWSKARERACGLRCGSTKASGSNGRGRDWSAASNVAVKGTVLESPFFVYLNDSVLARMSISAHRRFSSSPRRPPVCNAVMM